MHDMCLEPDEPRDAGNSGRGGAIGGVYNSVLFVPLLSWMDNDLGSVGSLVKLQPPECDYMDQFLLGESCAQYHPRL